jgi:hypothetical protein
LVLVMDNHILFYAKNTVDPKIDTFADKEIKRKA